MSKTLTIRVPISVARFLYSVIESYFMGNLKNFNPKLSPAARIKLAEFLETLAVELSTMLVEP